MRQKQTIKEIYNLNYEVSSVNSGLMKWYNRVLDKRLGELDEIDVSKMIRQDNLIELAIDSAIDILKDNPFAGEMYDGDLLNTLYSLVGNNKINTEQLKKLKKTVNEFKEHVSEFEWGDVSKEEQFIRNIENITAV